MQVAEFLRNYGQETALEFFRGEDLPGGLPNRPGLYAWYARPFLSMPERSRIVDGGTLKQHLEAHLLPPFRRQDYEVRLHAALEPEYRGELHHQRPVLSDWDLDADAARLHADGFYRFLSQAWAPAFSAPLYIGKAVRQPISKRIAQHLHLLETYSISTERPDLSTLLAITDHEERASHSFALEAASRGFCIDQLFLVTWAPEKMPADVLDTLEVLLNRIAFPLCGRR